MLRWFAAKKLHAELQSAEEQLGLYGWQAAHFGTQLIPTVSFLRELEEAQLTLVNSNADLAWEIQRIDEATRMVLLDYAKARQELAIAEGTGEEDSAEVREAHAKTESFERAVADLDRQLKELADMRHQVTISKLPAIDGQIRRSMIDSAQIQAERDELDLQRRLWKAKIFGTEKVRELHVSGKKDARGIFRKTRQALIQKLVGLKAERFRLFSQKNVSNREFQKVEEFKSNAYRSLGRVLADSQVAPPNQPELLQMVQHLRKEIAGLTENLRA